MFNPKINKAEQVYLKELANRRPDTTFTEIFSKVQNHLNKSIEDQQLNK
jgi:hypothetical protein